ncbi:hypothetical protein UFOVP222_49 [uncultured Caudovirales phage]|uniref:Uncharacterized protein n=1 Tax=uncultured Caudovirales phage TaxID=2100421 RepID=A0A6J7WRE1_9CAUD|nr:hypothetical protein UFOVP108_44 [uncultured Caudovirales phage]CAB5219282.1 hypothetical protein UFOVP222_49 [uncultured Caudovirales phage]
MAGIIPDPQRGQPIDFNYIYTIVRAVNDITTSISKQSANIHYKTNETGLQSLNFSSLAIDATTQTVDSTTVSSTKPMTGKYGFQTAFKSAPVVTITPLANGSSAGNDEAIVIIKNVTANEVNYTVNFPTATKVENASISVNIIAIGVAR